MHYAETKNSRYCKLWKIVSSFIQLFTADASIIMHITRILAVY